MRAPAAEVRERDDEADGAVAAHLQHADVVEENDAGDAGLVRGRTEQRADQHVRAARFVHDGGAETVVLRGEHFELLRDAAAAEVGPAADDDARGFAAGVGVNDLDALHRLPVEVGF